MSDGFLAPSPPVRAWTYGLTLISELVVSSVGLLIFRLVGARYGTSGFAAYQLGRGLLAFGAPAAMVGLGVAVPRFLAGSKGRRESEARSHVGGAVLIAGCTIAFGTLVLQLAAPAVSHLVFGDSAHVDLVGPLNIALIGLTLQLLVQAVFRGLLRIRSANAVHVLNNAILPIVAFLISHSTAELFGFLGAMWILVNLVVLTTLGLRPRFRGSYRAARNLLAFGSKRLVADLLMIGFLVLPQTLAAHISDLKTAGFVGFSVSAAALVSTIFAPVGLVLLPDASRLVASGRLESLQRRVTTVVSIGIKVSAFLCFAIALFAPYIVRFYLGPEFSKAAPYLRIVMAGGIPYAVYVVGRSVVDAMREQAINTWSVLIAVVAMFVSAGGFGMVFPGSIAVVAGFTVGLWTLGIRTFLVLTRLHAIVGGPGSVIRTPALRTSLRALRKPSSMD